MIISNRTIFFIISIASENRLQIYMFIRGLRIQLHILLAVSIIVFSGCKHDRLDVDLKGIRVELLVKRLDVDLFEMDLSSGGVDTSALIQKYDPFLTDYCEGIVRIGSPRSPSFQYSIAQFITDESMRKLYDDTKQQYADVSKLNAELTEAFSYFRYHFPDSAIPEVVYNISALNYGVVSAQNTLAIGLDMFLGADYPVYPLVGFPQYMYENMKREQVVPQAMKGWVQSMFEESTKRSTLLDHIVFEGKLLYALDAVLRDAPDSVRIGYSPQSMSWCSQYETKVWVTLVDSKLLYTTDQMDISKWVSQAPFIAGIPKQSPGRLGQWVGWQIVRKYMNEHPEVSLQELFSNNDAQSILAASKYKPK